MSGHYAALRPDELALLRSQLNLLGEGKLPWTRSEAAVMVRRLLETTSVLLEERERMLAEIKTYRPAGLS